MKKVGIKRIQLYTSTDESALAPFWHNFISASAGYTGDADNVFTSGVLDTFSTGANTYSTSSPYGYIGLENDPNYP